MIVRKLNAAGVEVWRYDVARVLAQDERSIQIEAFFKLPAERDEGYVVFKPQDRAVEYFYSQRWYNVFAIYDRDDGRLKGWYCNICRPAQWDDEAISCEDLALDVWVPYDAEDGRAGEPLILDEDEFLALSISDEERMQAQSGVGMILGLAQANELPC
ncbi:MAG: DUF402 domain-containing protein [Sphaerospermopsis sp. SIO1G2]|nr:DUF402 domain-containing protein [Sphaerospermopsis sp. SIO1G2]